MGNYRNLEHDFIDRTLSLISQYEKLLHKYKFEEQYNYTLLLNCLLGIIVMPKSRLYSHIPNHRINDELKIEMGLINSYINPEYIRLRDFITALRNSIAHFNIEIVSTNKEYLIDNIVFRKSADNTSPEIANFHAEELLPFMRYYACWIKTNLIENH